MTLCNSSRRERVHPANNQGRAVGFTLTEVMIVVAIVAVLAAIALPSYTQYVVRSNRADAMAELLNVAQAMERCYTRFSAYNAGGCAMATTLSGAGALSENGHYLVTSTALTATAFTIQAAPQGPQATRDTLCGTFTLTHTGVRGMTGAGDVAACWR